MRSLSTLVLCLLCGVMLWSQPQIALETIATGFANPVAVRSAGDGRLFVVERGGTVQVILEDGTIPSFTFLDIDDRVSNSGGERGLLGLAFHPAFADNGHLFVNYVNNAGNTVISRFTVVGINPNSVVTSTEKIILTVSQPFGNHNGGDIAFGPDGYLYIGLGDGGNGGDPGDRSQDRTTLLGKMLRIDIDTDEDTPYLIPEDNPFVNDDFTLDEIWSIGLRNPWRYSFDRATGDLWIADVGQNAFEEIDLQPAASSGGENYGWRCYEGDAPFNLSGCDDASNYVFPVYDYAHGANGCSITGGYVYRGEDYPGMQGYYIYADYCSDRIYGLIQENGEYVNYNLLDLGDVGISSFGEDDERELYMVGLSSGILYRVTDACGNLSAETIVQDDDLLSVSDGYTSYQWLLDGVPIDGATEATYTAMESGEYSVEITNAADCSVTICCSAFTVSTDAAAIGLQQLVLSPNPTADVLVVEGFVPRAGDYTVTLLTKNAQVLSQHSVNWRGHFNESFSVADLPSGQYLLRVANRKGAHTRSFQKL